MPFPPKLLGRNERIVLDLRPHAWFMFEPVVAVLGAVILGGLVINFFGDDTGVFWTILKTLAGILVLGCLAWVGVRYLKWRTTNFVITSDRLIYRSGVISKRGIEIPLERVNTVFFRQGIFERMIGAGDLTIESAGEMGRQRFSDIRRPSEVQNDIYHQMEENENRKFDRIDANIDRRLTQTGPPAGVEPSIPEQIERLDELRRKGLITDQEFAAKKAELLQRM
ncbi:MAG: PH domain-containing protein [Jiangellaceae bacterium]